MTRCPTASMPVRIAEQLTTPAPSAPKSRMETTSPSLSATERATAAPPEARKPTLSAVAISLPDISALRPFGQDRLAIRPGGQVRVAVRPSPEGSHHQEPRHEREALLLTERQPSEVHVSRSDLVTWGDFASRRRTPHGHSRTNYLSATLRPFDRAAPAV